MPRKRRRSRSRIYWRDRGGERRAYGDFRDYGDVGGGREALVAEGYTNATSDPVVAEVLAGRRLVELQERRRNRIVTGVPSQATFGDYVARHLQEKERSSAITPAWLEQAERHLSTASTFFGASRDLASITLLDVQAYASHLATLSNGRGATFSGGTRRHYLNSLSNLYRRAAGEGFVSPGCNPAAALMDKPSARRQEAHWLEVDAAARFLEAARTYAPKRPESALSCAFPLLATFLLTGGRESEVLGLEINDLSFDRSTITFRPNNWRRLKTRTSHRTIPMWPQLREILTDYISGLRGRGGALLFPSERSTEPRMVVDVRKMIDAVGSSVGYSQGAIRTKAFRHTYCAARLQTLDRGAPVSPWTVGRELGHGGPALVERVYGHLGEFRHRSEGVEYRVACL